MLRTSGKQDWRTPKWLFRHLDAVFDYPRKMAAGSIRLVDLTREKEFYK